MNMVCLQDMLVNIDGFVIEKEAYESIPRRIALDDYGSKSAGSNSIHTPHRRL